MWPAPAFHVLRVSVDRSITLYSGGSRCCPLSLIYLVLYWPDGRLIRHFIRSVLSLGLSQTLVNTAAAAAATMSNTLYYIPGSPPARALMITCRMLGLPVSFREMDFPNKENWSDWFLKVRRGFLGNGTNLPLGGPTSFELLIVGVVNLKMN